VSVKSWLPVIVVSHTASSCFPRKTFGDIDFTVLLAQVLNVSHPLALEGWSVYARQVVEGFCRKYTRTDPVLVESHAHKFLGLVADSRR
jgi:hypothetical protein